MEVLIWNPKLIEDILSRLNIPIPEEIEKSNISYLKESFISEITQLQTDCEAEDEDADDGELVFEIEGEMPEKDSEVLKSFLDFIGCSKYADDIIDQMYSEEFETAVSDNGFNFIENGAKNYVYGVYYITYDEVCQFLESKHHPISKEIFKSFIYDEYNE